MSPSSLLVFALACTSSTDSVTASELAEVEAALDARIAELEAAQTGTSDVATQEELDAVATELDTLAQECVVEEELDAYATDSELAAYATTAEVEACATDADLENVVSDLQSDLAGTRETGDLHVWADQLSYVDYSATEDTDLETYRFEFTKASATSALRITWTDAFGAEAGPGEDGFCQWNISVDDVSCSDPGALFHQVYVSNEGNDETWAVAYAVSTYTGICRGVEAGETTLEVSVSLHGGARRCYTGPLAQYQGPRETPFYFEIEEIEDLRVY